MGRTYPTFLVTAARIPRRSMEQKTRRRHEGYNYSWSGLDCYMSSTSLIVTCQKKRYLGACRGVIIEPLGEDGTGVMRSLARSV